MAENDVPAPPPESPPPPAAPPTPPYTSYTHPPPRRSPSAARNARLLLGISLIGLLALGAVTAGVVALVRDGGGAGVTENSYLELVVDGSISDSPTQDGLVFNPEDLPPVLTDVTTALRKAATDERITGLYVEIQGGGSGWGTTRELRQALVDFQASGKPCHVYAEAYDNAAYYLASACKNIYLAPAGIFLVNGLSVTTTYYAGTFEKLGVVANFEHVGDFKSAVEPFERPGPSDAASEATNFLLDGLYGQMINEIAEGRGWSPEQARAHVDNPPITPDAALKAGVVDGLKYRDEVREGIAGKERTNIHDYLSDAGLGTGKTIAVIHADGAIVSGESGQPLFGGQMVGDKTFAEHFEEIREDDDVVAVVLRVNSPGGSGMASDMMWREIQRTRAAGKPVVTSMADYAASGGYYIAAGTDYIVAQPNTITGSIGVFGGKLNINGVYEKVGMSHHTWQRGQLATLFSEVSSFNDVERAKFREFLGGFYEVFLSRVVDGRKMERDAVHAVAQGRVWTGQQALERGLVDELGGLDAAINKARSLAGLTPEEEIHIERFPRRKTLIDQIVEDLEQASLPAEARLPGVREAWADLEVMDRVLADGGVAAMLPVRLDVK